jgi:hypothetical protein
MRTHLVNLLAIAVALFAPVALGQSAYRAGPAAPVPPGLVGAGGIGGAGGGATGRTTAVVVVGEVDYVNRNPSYVTHTRSSEPPPMDPSRLVYEVDCTKAFFPLGKGNLRCM